MKAAVLGVVACLGLLLLPACQGRGGVAPTDIGAGFAIRPSAKSVDLVYVGGEECVSVEDPAFVFKAKKPKKVRWWVDPAKEYHWEFVHVTKPNAQDDYFGSIEAVGCNDNHTTSAKNSGVPDDMKIYYWHYKVRIYECVDDERGELLCESPDPRIGIRRKG